MTTNLNITTNLEDLLTVKQAAAVLKVGTTWLYEACRLNQVPHVRLGTNIRFEPEQLRAYVKAQRHGPGAPTSATVLALPGGRR